MWCNIFYTTSQHYYSETDFAHISECCTAYRTYADRLTCWLVQHIQTPKHGWLEPPCQAKSLISEGCRDQTWISPCHLLRFRVIKYSLNQWQHGIVWNLCFKYCREGLVFKLHESVRAQTCKGSRQCKKKVWCQTLAISGLRNVAVKAALMQCIITCGIQNENNQMHIQNHIMSGNSRMKCLEATVHVVDWCHCPGC